MFPGFLLSNRSHPRSLSNSAITFPIFDPSPMTSSEKPNLEAEMLENGREEFSSPQIKLKVYHDVYQHEVSVPARATFGELKMILAPITGLVPHEQRLLFRCVRRNDDNCLHAVGVKDMAKVVLLQDLSSRKRKMEDVKKNENISKAYLAVVSIRSEIDNLAEKVATLELKVNNGTKVEEKQFVVLTELLMIQLLKLDTVEADGEAKIQRKTEVHRVQSLVDALDVLKVRNSESSSSSSAVSVTTQ